jgi:hypothetical protein
VVVAVAVQTVETAAAAAAAPPPAAVAVAALADAIAVAIAAVQVAVAIAAVQVAVSDSVRSTNLGELVFLFFPKRIIARRFPIRCAQRVKTISSYPWPVCQHTQPVSPPVNIQLFSLGLFQIHSSCYFFVDLLISKYNPILGDSAEITKHVYVTQKQTDDSTDITGQVIPHVFGTAFLLLSRNSQCLQTRSDSAHRL